MKHKGSTISAAGLRFLAGTCIATLAIAPQAAFAQGDAGAGEPGGDRIGEIVVTARYVAESIQDTPIAITAKTSEQLAAANVTNIGTLGAVVPNLQTLPGDAQSAGTPFISLRGVQQGASSSLAVPPAIGIYTDDIYHATTAGSELDFTDVVRVEVNRGPQSTLSGNASIGGSIKLFTQDPKGDGSGFASLGYGSRNHMEAAGAIDIGLSPSLSLRALGHFDTQTGFGNRLDFTCMMNKLGTPELAGSLPYFQPDSDRKGCVIGHIGGGTTAVGQVKLQWQPSEDIRLLLTARHRREDMEETAEGTQLFPSLCTQPTSAYPAGVGRQPCPLSGAGAVNGPTQLIQLAIYDAFGVVLDSRFIPPARNGGTYDTYSTNCRPSFDLSLTVGTFSFPAGYPHNICYEPRKRAEHTLFSGKLEAALGEDVNLTAIAGYTDYSNEFTSTADGTPFGATISHFLNEDEFYSGEVRLDGKLFDGKLQWIVGAFAMKMDGYQKNVNTFSNNYQKSVVHGVNKSQSGFFHLDYNFTDAWRVSGGARYTHTDIAITIDNPQAVSVIDPRHSVQNRWDWLISTDYKISDDILIYATAATGSRPPGLTTIVQNSRQLAPTSDEELISYEAGIKADWFDRRLRTNLTAFYLDYKKLSTAVNGTQCSSEPGTGQATFHNVQFGTAEATSLCQQLYGGPGTVQYNYNVGIPATVRGVEWEITAIPVEGLRIDWTGGYNKFKSDVEIGKPGALYPGNHRQAEWSMHANVSYDIESAIGTFTPRLDWSWQSQQDYDPQSSNRAPQALFIIPAYSIWNAQFAYKSPDEDWSATLSVSNLADRYTHYQVLTGSTSSRGRIGPPREWMLTVRKNF